MSAIRRRRFQTIVQTMAPVAFLRNAPAIQLAGRGYFTPNNSTSKIKVEFPGMSGGLPTGP
jgi:hypothetical protein